MFKNKLEVDRHVQDMYSKLKTESERHSRGFAIAKQYFHVGDFKTAQKHVCNYLSIKETSAPAHKLLGQIYDGMGLYHKALVSYKRSLDLENGQKDVVRKVCELYTKVPLDKERAQVWIERGMTMFPGDPVIFKLQEYILHNSDKSPTNMDELQKLIEAEVHSRPNDPELRCKLLRVYLGRKKVAEAYSYAMEVEKSKLFLHSLDWYQTLLEVQREHLKEGIGDGSFYSTYLRVIDKLLELAWGNAEKKDNKAVALASSHLQMMDEILLQARQLEKQSKGWMEMLRHFLSQFHLHMATLLLKKNEHELEVVKPMCIVLFLSAFNNKPPDRHSTDLKHLYSQACYRVSLSGHMLINLSGKNQMRTVHTAHQKFCCAAGQKTIYEKMFSKSAPTQSAFLTDQMFPYLTVEYPSAEELREYDEAWTDLYPDQLHHLVWLCLQQYDNKDNFQPDYGLNVFPSLPEETANYHTANSTSLSRMDAEAFLYATVKCTSQRLTNSGGLLPVNLCEPLCTDDQSQWWRCASKLASGPITENVGEVKRSITAGLEAVRLLGVHGMSPELVVHLARTFQAKGSDMKVEDQDLQQTSVSDSRCAMYWEWAVSAIEKLKQNHNLPVPKQPMFSTYGRPLSKESLKQLLAEGQLALGLQAERNNNEDTALKLYMGLKSPTASFRMAHIYKRQANRSQGEKAFTNRKYSDSDKDDRKTMLELARDSLYLTSDRLRSPQVSSGHPLKKVLADQMQEVESELSRIEFNGDCQHESSGSSEGDTEEGRIISSIPKPKTASTPIKRHILRQEVRPSPERLDAQLRSLEVSQSSVMKVLLEQNKTLVQQNRMLHDTYNSITELVKENKEALKNLKTELELHREVMKDLQRESKMNDKHGRKGSDQTEPESEDYEGQYVCEDNSQSNNENGSELHSSYALPGFPAWPSNPLASYSAGGLAGCYYPQQPPRNTHPLGYYTSMGLQLTDPSNLSVGGSSPFAIAPVPSVGIRPMDMPPGKIKGPSTPLTTPGGTHDLPANVTITTRETMPAVTAAPPLSVVVPVVSKTSVSPAPHSYQITLPSTTISSPLRDQIEGSDTPAVPLTTSSLLSSVPPPTYSAVTPSPPKTTTAERTRRTSSSAGRRTSIDGTKDRKDSACSEYEDEHDPMPDFEPIIPLPEEVEVNTGEEDEQVLFCERAKLYRFVDKEWKERGLGLIKILFHPETKKARVVMRREQVLKLCANHFILPNMYLKPLNNKDNTWVWAAQDYADGKCVRENFCVRFKLAESATAFKEAFEKAQKISVVGEGSSPAPKTDTTKSKPEANNKADNKQSPDKMTFGGFTFTSKPKVNETQKTVEKPSTETKEPLKPFAQFSFSTPTTTSSGATPTFGIGTGIAASTGNIFSGTPSKPVTLFGKDTKTQTDKDSKPQENAANQPVTLMDLCKPKPGSWECTSCLVRNDKDHEKCACCDTPNPNAPAKTESDKSTAFKDQGPSLAELLKPKVGSWECKGCLVRNDADVLKCPCCDTPKPGGTSSETPTSKPVGFSVFGGPAASSTGFTFGNFGGAQKATTGGSMFGSSTTTTTTATPASGFTFGNFEQGNQKGMGFSFQPSTTTMTTTTSSAPSQKTDFSFTSASFGSSGFRFGQPPASNATGCIFSGTAILTSSVPPPPSSAPLAMATPGSTFGTTIVTFSAPASSTTGSGSIFGGANSISKPSNNVYGPSFSSFSTPFTQNLFKPQNAGGSAIVSSAGSPAPPTTQPPQVAASFTVNLPKGITCTPVGNKAGMEDAKPPEIPGSIFGGSAANALPSFGSLGTQSAFSFHQEPPVTPPKEASPFKFGGPQNQKYEFSFNVNKVKSPTKTPKSPEDIKPGSHDDSNDYYEDDGEGDRIYFHPVIPLPDEVEVKTGEEDEEVIYSHRAKLFRFKDKEWKERGLGDVKMLEHKATKKIRLLMRRERVHKICLNHYLTPDIKFSEKDEKSYTWHAMDFSEGKSEQELFAIKFKTPEIATEFMDAVKKAQNSPNEDGEEEHKSPKATNQKTPPVSFDNFSFSPTEKSIFGGTQLNSVNQANFSFGMGSEPPKEGAEAKATEDKGDDEVVVVYEKSVTEEQRRKAESLMLPPNFYSYEDKEPCPGCRGCTDDLSRPDAAPKNATSSTVSEEKNKDEKTPKTRTETPSLFGNKAVSQFSFSALAQQSTGYAALNKSSESKSNPWAQAGAKVFGAPAAASADSDGEGEVDNTHDPHFEPIVPLPALIEVKTGEEESEKLFGERTKLFRFNKETKEWKERGIGEMKILKEKSGKVRLLLRREQVHKVVCNHWLTPSMQFLPLNQSDKALLWTALNVSDDCEEGQNEQLALKFKNSEICDAFKETIKRCQEEMERRSSDIPEVVKDLENTYEYEDEDDDDDDDDDEDDEDEEEEDSEDDADYDDDDDGLYLAFSAYGDVSAYIGETWEELGQSEVKILHSEHAAVAYVQICQDEDMRYSFPINTITSVHTGGNVLTWTAATDDSQSPTRYTVKFVNQGEAQKFEHIHNQYMNFTGQGS